MDLKSLKLELLERIALLDDEARLLALKRLLDAPRGYGIPNENLNVVREGEGSYLRIEDRDHSSEEVRQIIWNERQRWESGANDPDLSDTDLAELDRRHRELGNGVMKSYTWDEVQRILDDDRRRQRSGK